MLHTESTALRSYQRTDRELAALRGERIVNKDILGYNDGEEDDKVVEGVMEGIEMQQEAEIDEEEKEMKRKK